VNLTVSCSARIRGHIDFPEGDWTVIDRQGKSFVVTRIDFVVDPRPELPAGFVIDFISANGRKLKANGEPGAVGHRLWFGQSSGVDSAHIPAEVRGAAEVGYRELVERGLPE
jgi:hypothetical protein